MNESIKAEPPLLTFVSASICKSTLLRIGLRGDTSPPNGCCRGTSGSSAGTTME